MVLLISKRKTERETFACLATSSGGSDQAVSANQLDCLEPSLNATDEASNFSTFSAVSPFMWSKPTSMKEGLETKGIYRTRSQLRR
jgi:hypothetical protein